MREYRWPGRSPADVPLEELPVLTKGRFSPSSTPSTRAPRRWLCPGAATRRWARRCRGSSTTSSTTMDFDGNSLDELARPLLRRRCRADSQPDHLRLPRARHQSDQVHHRLVGQHYCVCVHDFETGITHLPAACAPPPDLETLFAQLRAQRWHMSKKPPPVGVILRDFYAFLPKHKYIFAPTGDLWPIDQASLPSAAEGRNAGARCRTTEIHQSPARGSTATVRSQAMTWAPGEREAIVDKLPRRRLDQTARR